MTSPTDTLRAALERSGTTRYAVAKATGIPESVLCRFVQGGTLQGPNFDRLCDYLKLELRPLTPRASRAAKGHD